VAAVTQRVLFEQAVQVTSCFFKQIISIGSKFDGLNSSLQGLCILTINLNKYFIYGVQAEACNF